MTSENNTPKRYLASETTLHLKQSIVCLRFDMQPLNGIIYETSTALNTISKAKIN